MAPRLTSETKRRLDLLFQPDDRDEAERLLVDECGNNLPFHENSNERDLERLRFAALKQSRGDLKNLRNAISMAKTDWRDLLMSAGFGENIHAHSHWNPEPKDHRRQLTHNHTLDQRRATADRGCFAALVIAALSSLTALIWIALALLF